MVKWVRPSKKLLCKKDITIVLRIDDQNLHELTKENLQKADVAIEFTVLTVQYQIFCYVLMREFR